jgi:hypothetical protein
LVCRGFVELSLTEVAGHLFNSRSPKSQALGRRYGPKRATPG